MSAVHSDMPTGADQVYIVRASDGWRLYRSPDGRHAVIDLPAYRTPREALAARRKAMGQ
jgi:hypothetical protein